MFKLSDGREIEISRKIAETPEHKIIQGKLSELFNYIEENIKNNEELARAFSDYEDMNCELMTLCENHYYKEGFKDGVSLYNDERGVA